MYNNFYWHGNINVTDKFSARIFLWYIAGHLYPAYAFINTRCVLSQLFSDYTVKL